MTWTCVGSAELCARETDERRASASRSTSCLSRPPSHWYLFETCHFPEPSQCASLDHQLLPSQFDSGDSSISGPSNFVLFSFFHFIRRFCKKDKQANSSKLFNSRQTRAQYFAYDRHYCRNFFCKTHAVQTAIIKGSIVLSFSLIKNCHVLFVLLTVSVLRVQAVFSIENCLNPK